MFIVPSHKIVILQVIATYSNVVYVFVCIDEIMVPLCLFRHSKVDEYSKLITKVYIRKKISLFCEWSVKVSGPTNALLTVSYTYVLFSTAAIMHKNITDVIMRP